MKIIALAQSVNRKTVWEIKKKYELFGCDGLKTHKCGRLFEPLNSKFYDLIVAEWKKNKCGARKLHAIFKRKGCGVSKRKIEQVLVAEGLQKKVPNRSKPRKYKRYEWPIPNYMWHTDWHTIKSEKLKGEKILVYIDDCSRKIMSYIIGAETTK
ncbi:MAG: transposase family protein, partial [archaeon]|nr:transposase family protein [archaeon]